MLEGTARPGHCLGRWGAGAEAETVVGRWGAVAVVGRWEPEAVVGRWGAEEEEEAGKEWMLGRTTRVVSS